MFFFFSSTYFFKNFSPLHPVFESKVRFSNWPICHSLLVWGNQIREDLSFAWSSQYVFLHIFQSFAGVRSVYMQMQKREVTCHFDGNFWAIVHLRVVPIILLLPVASWFSLLHTEFIFLLSIKALKSAFIWNISPSQYFISCWSKLFLEHHFNMFPPKHQNPLIYPDTAKLWRPLQHHFPEFDVLK